MMAVEKGNAHLQYQIPHLHVMLRVLQGDPEDIDLYLKVKPVMFCHVLKIKNKNKNKRRYTLSHCCTTLGCMCDDHH